MAVNAKNFSAAFFHISSLKNANTRNNTAASKQPNLFWFWDYLYNSSFESRNIYGIFLYMRKNDILGVYNFCFGWRDE